MVVIRFDEQHCKFLWFGSDPRRFSWVICMVKPIRGANLLAQAT